MIERASDIGDLAARVLSRGGVGEVTRTFPSAAYFRSGDDYFVLLRGTLRSPMTVNLPTAGGASEGLRVGEEIRLDEKGISALGVRVATAEARVFRSPLRTPGRFVVPPARRLAKGMMLLRSLYDVSPANPTLPGDRVFREFIRSTLPGFASAGRPSMFKFESYADLIGRGGGFTPAGDDFVNGFVTTYNYVARRSNHRQILFSKDELFRRTVPESAAMLWYGSRGHVDEGLGRLVLKSLRGDDFGDELSLIARRGHTSGLDLGLGVLFCEAMLSAGEGSGSLEACESALWA